MGFPFTYWMVDTTSDAVYKNCVAGCVSQGLSRRDGYARNREVVVIQGVHQLEAQGRIEG